AATDLAVDGAIFEAALSLDDPTVRQSFLERAFRGNPAGLERMKDLLDSSRHATPFFLEAREVRGMIASEIFREMSPRMEQEAEPEPASPPERIGSSIGQYHLVRCLGVGGSGIVYEAEQREPIQRRVALKIINIDTESEAAKARFDIERRALAIMDHPNIAKVLDAGGNDNGSPYFVMELVKGEPITEYCDRERLSLRQRIELFTDVCGAIQHAHSKRIIHRDIKPSNVLVSVLGNKPVVKVIDFGIAKAVSPELKIHPLLTSHDQFVGTPAYMSPEQVEMIGVDVDTRSDIYSLGVLLYELLTSHTPFDRRELVNSGVAAMRKMLLDEQHPRPSVKFSGLADEELGIISKARNTEAAKLLVSLKGDLDLIVMKALEKDRNHRYETANGLAIDLRMYLENKPVSVRKPTNIYSFKKFISRNKIPFFSATAVAASILLGFGTSVTLYFRERSALAEQERLSIEAERSRDQEHNLRRQAQARANVSRVAFLLSEGKVQEADEILQGNPLESIEPSKEASSVFRGLGNWYGTYGKWDEAVKCFRLMNQATSLSSSAEILRSADLLITGPALIESGDMHGYEVFRKNAVQKLLPVSNSLEAEHILKACLLTPPSPQMLDEMEDAAMLCHDSIESSAKGKYPAWEAFSLALYHYRAGNFAEVIRTGNLGLSFSGIKEVCAASLRILMAHAHQQLGDADTAAILLAQGAAVLKRERLGDLTEENAVLPHWYDWSAASILLREIETTGISQSSRPRGR
ncbi:MAG: serine/threonine protein kinase, partial [Verrucomicrobiaceae bacterium]